MTRSPRTVVTRVARALFPCLACLAAATACGRAPRAGADSAPADPAASPVPPPTPAAAMDAHLAKLRPKVPAGFQVVPVPPFVVIGKGSAADVEAWAEMVRWTVRMLEQDFVSKRPTDLIDVWLFPDDATYRTWAWRLFRDRPSTPFGYYSPDDRALVMNIATGGGTLVHELVHPMLHADFPAVPPWFNECLAALYEQSGEEDGHIVGYPNWRLPGLQTAIRERRIRSLEDLLRLDPGAFYVRSTGLETAQARYVCLYLQDHSLLRRFYRKFRDAAANDPTGRDTLLDVVQDDSLTAFQDRWERFVLALSR
ncbi:MAG: hypothetical protein HY905_02670 [Deltaproteobacteria bacterium]|nr:hypothetical protein [Deltaproteobacteria bacterium]